MPNPNPKVPPKELRLKALGVEPLGPDEVSASMRIRAPKAVFEVARRLSAKEKGEALRAGLVALGLLEEDHGA